MESEAWITVATAELTLNRRQRDQADSLGAPEGNPWISLSKRVFPADAR
jgi:hypothetical protein